MSQRFLIRASQGYNCRNSGGLKYRQSCVRMEVIIIQGAIVLAEDIKKRNKRQYEWQKANTTQVLLKFNHNTDQDILAAIENASAKATEIKRLLRVAIATEKETL